MSRNDITGDSLVSKTANQAYRDGWDRIFGKKKEEKKQAPEVGEEGYSEYITRIMAQKKP
jgi:hypothetical protein